MFAYCSEQSMEDDSRQILDLVECVHLCRVKLFGIAASSDVDSRAEILLGSASIPRLDMRKLSNFPAGTPKVHLVGFNFSRYLLRLSNVSLKSLRRS